MFKSGFVFFRVIVEDELKSKFKFFLDFNFNFLFYFVIIYKLICFFKMGGWRGIFIIILLATSVFIVQTMDFVCHVGYFR